MIKEMTISNVVINDMEGRITFVDDDCLEWYPLADKKSSKLFNHIISKLKEYTGAKNITELSGKKIRVFYDKCLFDRAYGHINEDKFVLLEFDNFTPEELTEKQLVRYSLLHEISLSNY